MIYIYILYTFLVCVTQLYPTLCDPVDYSPPGSSVHGILQARILEWLPFPFPGDLPDPGIESGSSAWQADSLPSEPPGKPIYIPVCSLLLTFFLAALGLVCGMWDLASWPGIEFIPPALGVLSLNHWSTREYLLLIFNSILIAVLVSQQNWGKGTYTPASTHTKLPPLSTARHQGGMFVTIDKPILTHHNHGKSIVCNRGHVVHSMGLGKFAMTCLL